MSKVLSAALFTSLATAQMTTSAWMPGLQDSQASFSASVISVNKDRTVLSLDYSGLTDMAQPTQTITIGGNTYYGFEAAATDEGFAVTISGACSRENTDAKSATCTATTIGLASAISAVCSGPQSNADLCSSISDLELSMTTTLPEDYFGTFPVVITAGNDLLPSASAAATPSAGSASATASGFKSSQSPSPTGSASNAAGASSSPSQTGGKPAEATGGAPVIMAPALAGMGAALAAFFL
ncbi:hypothetical protein PtrSN002B_009548 [Pyrenophora tritici-repentis]|uniref:Uncharacterized protein n=2 Tax=Pyrenophora tritici-repentis TaxID=45151 RepID=A0A2W1DID8_9PLEO|nr:uncharacterized protein PTRG_10583 [Pyrenophora tritici-repentis Pt-1C-BFP]KAA8621245.1 hypothetical protein PtrV1_05746 [Pyrenophora tritici-repentis]EDU43633.1 hypothetical protein PTRG_10583 [Pyrenophora tritici-repentis Pt-1C-BFP]KAF7450481.1 hypothetical protein A1F99_050970 [Pyrenophora tritici-repentis]KAF7573097.1 hypothetical protein PtrM4_080020 [Pyrenophora tritici-repentis]KAG9381294.1 hypothetical protein A1F94_008614 [Pyrenophora tritici-repentis]